MGSYVCSSRPGYNVSASDEKKCDGNNCDDEINECTNDPCNPTGTTPDGCEDLPHGYKCSCKDGFSGHDCEVANTGDGCKLTADYCSVKGLCKNGGTCKLVFSGYKCHCADGFQGDECETPVKGCSGVTCKNGGTCISSGGHNYCECPVDKEGHDCDRGETPVAPLLIHTVTLLHLPVSLQV
ncbi:hypothetical protein NP493_1752g00004 [Ridgeia piscesae]|uniref:EGF-like domain-containing protein n=1 Tax=Ridgeia piscesae TaxID=27915 RepID=A0AAD9JU19_RIDPI|nr:hypothetical protein NP493_1752g00004 [Ridgeia piscesae]